MKIKLLLSILLLSLLISVLPLSLSSCGGGKDEVSVFYYTYSDAYISSVRTEMDAYFKRMGIRYHNYDSNSNQTTQTEQVDTAIAKGTQLFVQNTFSGGGNAAQKAAYLPWVKREFMDGRHAQSNVTLYLDMHVGVMKSSLMAEHYYNTKHPDNMFKIH